MPETKNLVEEIRATGSTAQPRVAWVLELLTLLDALAPEYAINQDELGGCVWCAGTPPGEPYGYAKDDPSHHKGDCPWFVTRRLLDAVGWTED